MSLWLSIGFFLLWQLLVLWGALRLVRFGRGPRLPAPAAVPAEWRAGAWTEGVDPATGDPTGAVP